MKSLRSPAPHRIWPKAYAAQASCIARPKWFACDGHPIGSANPMFLLVYRVTEPEKVFVVVFFSELVFWCHSIYDWCECQCSFDGNGVKQVFLWMSYGWTYSHLVKSLARWSMVSKTSMSHFFTFRWLARKLQDLFGLWIWLKHAETVGFQLLKCRNSFFSFFFWGIDLPRVAHYSDVSVRLQQKSLAQRGERSCYDKKLLESKKQITNMDRDEWPAKAELGERWWNGGKILTCTIHDS